MLHKSRQAMISYRQSEMGLAITKRRKKLRHQRCQRKTPRLALAPE